MPLHWHWRQQMIHSHGGYLFCSKCEICPVRRNLCLMNLEMHAMEFEGLSTRWSQQLFGGSAWENTTFSNSKRAKTLMK